jgi:predicted RecB family nuclease
VFPFFFLPVPWMDSVSRDRVLPSPPRCASSPPTSSRITAPIPATSASGSGTKASRSAEPTEFEQVLHRLGDRHEREHLATLGAYLDLSRLAEEERVPKTVKAIAGRVPVIYQPGFRVTHTFGGSEAEVVGIPDFLILDGDGYMIRDAKMARRIDDENHPEILLQVQLYGRLLEPALEWLVAIKRLDTEPYEPVGWSKCGPCGYDERCWNRAEAAGDVAIVPDVDQSLARTLNGIGVRTCGEPLTRFDAVSLSELKRPFGNAEQRVGKRAERILLFAEAIQKREEKILVVSAIPPLPNYAMFDLEGMPPHLDELQENFSRSGATYPLSIGPATRKRI